MKENKYSILSDHQKETIYWVFRNTIESVCDFFGRRIHGGFMDSISTNIGPLLNILYKHPHFYDKFQLCIQNVNYGIEVFGGSIGDKWDDYPTIRIKKTTDKYSEEIIDSIIEIVYMSSNTIKVTFLNNFPIEIKAIRTMNQLKKYFGWSEKHLEEFYNNMTKYSVSIL